MDFTLQALADEINNDPIAVGYKDQSGNWKSDNEIAVLLNSQTRLLNRDEVQSSLIRASVTYDAFEGLTASEESWLRWLTTGESVAVTADTLALLAGIGGSSVWGSPDKATMEPRMQSLMQFTGSRMEELFGGGFVATASMVGQSANV